jgi:DNA-binding NarL/FixJ family response regulator
MGGEVIRVLLADDQALVRADPRILLETCGGGFEVRASLPVTWEAK